MIDKEILMEQSACFYDQRGNKNNTSAILQVSIRTYNENESRSNGDGALLLEKNCSWKQDNPFVRAKDI